MLTEPCAQPVASEVTELDERYTFASQKKNEVYLVTAVDRATCCIVGHTVVRHRSFEIFQEVVDQAPHANKLNPSTLSI